MAQVSHRERLLEGAVECLQTKGFARTTARDIAAASGANLASIGYHFGSKDALLHEALIRVFEERNRRLGRATPGGEEASAVERMTALFVAVRRLFERHRPLLVAFVEAMAEAAHSPDLRRRLATHYRDARRGIASTLEEALGEAAEGMETDLEVMASLLMATFDGLVLQWLLDPAATPKGDALFDALVEWMERAGGGSARSPSGAKRRMGEQHAGRGPAALVEVGDEPGVGGR